MRLLPCLVPTLALAAPDAARAAGDGPVIEVVSFRLVAGTPEADFLAAAAATEPPLRTAPGFVARRLVRAEGGVWTDLVEWSSLGAAQAGAQAMTAEPAFGAFVALIDMDSLTMRHDALRWRMD
ncbi:MAG: hypothetical protein KF887_12310 [Paracoccaceae bacterium]|nr:MAG: hypothetical protein KF887_12310 [Paracoccaceae bacterium]